MKAIKETESSFSRKGGKKWEKSRKMAQRGEARQ